MKITTDITNDKLFDRGFYTTDNRFFKKNLKGSVHSNMETKAQADGRWTVYLAGIAIRDVVSLSEIDCFIYGLEYKNKPMEAWRFWAVSICYLLAFLTFIVWWFQIYYGRLPFTSDKSVTKPSQKTITKYPTPVHRVSIDENGVTHEVYFWKDGDIVSDIFIRDTDPNNQQAVELKCKLQVEERTRLLKENYDAVEKLNPK